MTRFVSPNPGSEQSSVDTRGWHRPPPSFRPLREPAKATHPPGRRRGILLLSLIAWLTLGFSTGVLVAIRSLPVVAETPDVAAAPRPQPMVLASPGASFGQTRFWRPAGSIAQRPETRLEPRRFRPALRLAGSHY